MTQHLKKRIVFFLLFIFTSGTFAFGQISEAELGINGLTCSQCSRSVEMQMKKLDFIQSMQMDLKDTKLALQLNGNKTIDWYLIPKAVNDAGFSTRYLFIALDNIPMEESKNYFIFQNIYFYIIDANIQTKLKGQYQLIGKEFMPKREFAKYKLPKLPELKNKKLIYLKAVQ